MKITVGCGALAAAVILTTAFANAQTPAPSHPAAVAMKNISASPQPAAPAPKPEPEHLKTYDADGRASLDKIYATLSTLERNGLWKAETVFADGGLPMKAFRTNKKGPALWLLAGIHGEEPAPPNAVYENIDKLNALAAQGTPIVLLPLCNPAGYSKNWRYPDAEKYSESNPGYSVGDSDYLLPDSEGKSRSAGPSSPQARSLAGKILELAKEYPPILSIDLHEDNMLAKGYLYSQGPEGAHDKAAQAIARKIHQLRYPLLLSGKTRFGEPIENGIVAGAKDGSIDELIASRIIITDGKPCPGPAGKSVIVVETSAMNSALKERTRVHAAIIGMLGELYQTALKSGRPSRQNLFRMHP